MERIKVKGLLEIFNVRTGELLYRKQNLVVNTGLNLMIDRMKVNTKNPLSYCAVGTGANLVTATDSSLQTEIARKLIDNIDTVNNVLIATTQFEDYEAVANWKEVAMLNDSVGGVMFNRINIDFNKTTQDAVKVQFTITLSAV